MYHTQDILVGGSLGGDSEPNDVDPLKASWDGVDEAATIEALQQTLGQCVVAAETKCNHSYNKQMKITTPKHLELVIVDNVVEKRHQADLATQMANQLVVKAIW